jgi:hypothetical protein
LTTSKQRSLEPFQADFGLAQGEGEPKVNQQAAKGAQALAQAFVPSARDEEVLFYLPVTKAWLRQVVLGLVLLCHRSFRGVMAFFRDLLDCPLSLGSVHAIVRQAFTCWISPPRAYTRTTPSPTAGAAGGPVKRWPGPGCPARGMSFMACRNSPV